MSDKNIYQRINEIKRNISYIKKNKLVEITSSKSGAKFEYSAVTHDAVNAMVREHFIEHGVLAVPRVISHTKNHLTTSTDMEIDFINIDNPEDRFTMTWFAYGEDFSDKGPGKAQSYCVKNAYLKLLQIETGEDDESRIQKNPVKESDILKIKEAAEEMGFNEEIIKYLVKQDYKLESIEKLETHQVSHFIATMEVWKKGRDKFLKAASDLAESITVISNALDNEDYPTAAEAWAELTNDEIQSIWKAPKMCKVVNVHPPFTTKQRDILHSGVTHPDERKLFKEALDSYQTGEFNNE